LPVLAPIRK